MTLSRTGTSPLNPLRALFPGRNAEARFQHALEQMPGCALVVVPRTGQFLALNGRATALTGWTREELLTRTLAEVVSAPESLAHFYAIQAGNVRHLQNVPLRTRFGQTLPVDARLSALEESGEIVVLMVATPAEDRLVQERDRTRLAQMLASLHTLLELLETATPEALQSALERVAAMFQADAAGLLRTVPDPPSLLLEHRLNVPTSFPNIIGPSETQWLTTPLNWSSAQRGEGFLPQAFRSAGWTHVLAQPLGQAPTILGAVIIAYRPGNLPASAAPAFLEVAALQLTHLIAQIGRQAKLQDAQRLAFHLTHQLDAITAQVREGVMTLNSSGTVDELSSAAARMLGYRAEDVIGLRFEDVLCADDALTALIRSALAEDSSRERQREGFLHRRDGERFPVMARMRSLPAPSGGCVLILHDLTRERADEVQRQHVDHLAYVGQSTQSFAHEVRAPLNNISMGVQYLAARLPPDNTVQLALAKIQAEAGRLSTLMNDMLAWAKPVDPRLTSLDLNGLLRRLLSRWSAKLQQRNVSQTFTAPDECPAVLADPFLIERVFVNLIENALQAMPAGGHLAISIQVTDRGPAGRVLETRVGDSGPGIPEEHRKHVFDPYFTTKADGTGLGLAICKRIVTVHRGALNVESFPGTGSIFTVTLPVLAGEPPPPEATT